MTIEITPELLANLRQTATNCQPPIWKLDEHSDVISDHHKVAMCNFSDDAQHIAAADPATVLALVAEIERLTGELQEKQRLIDKICEMEKNRWESAVKAFHVRPNELEVGR
jgi:hypothetical protein